MKKKLLPLFVMVLTAHLHGQVIPVSGDITANTTWHNNNIYLLKSGCVNVINNAILDIEPGTIIRAEQGATLVIAQGAKIFATGTETQPIVFTSEKPAGQRQPGDWNGIIICGKAPIGDIAGTVLADNPCQTNYTLFGGNDPLDNSGVLNFVRIEYAGQWSFSSQNGYGFFLAGVGAGTEIEQVQVSSSSKDSFRFSGGNVNARWLVSNRAYDDMMDISNGYQGKIQWVVGVNDNDFGDPSGTHGIEIDGLSISQTELPVTNNTITNVSLFGPRLAPLSGPLPSRALHFRWNVESDIFNSVFGNFGGGLRLLNTAYDNFLDDSLELENCYFAGLDVLCWHDDTLNLLHSEFEYGGNDSLGQLSDLLLGNPYQLPFPDFRPQDSSLLLVGADFSSPALQGSFFTPVAHKGAFNKVDWTDCWSEWMPQSADYDNPPLQYPQPMASAIDILVNGNAVTFSADIVGAADIFWDFGDSSPTSSELNPTHLYSPGVYEVKLTLVSERGCTASAFAMVDLTTDTKELDEVDFLDISPNPFSSRFTISFFSKRPQQFSFRLSDSKGRVLRTDEHTFGVGLQQIEFSGNNLASGVYFLSFQSEGGTKTLRLVKN